MEAEEPRWQEWLPSKWLPPPALLLIQQPQLQPPGVGVAERTISASRMAKAAVAWTAGRGADEDLLLLLPLASSRSQRAGSVAAWVVVRATSLMGVVWQLWKDRGN